MKIIKHLFILLFVIIPLLGISQQREQFSQYMFNTISINPAYAGSREFMVISLLNRNQWVGVNGAPITQTLTAHTSIPNSKLGVGLSLINDKLGFERTTHTYADLAYTLNVSKFEAYKVAFGVKVGASKYSLDSRLTENPINNTDPFLNTINYKWTPNVGAGIYFRGESFYLGLSAPKLITYKKTNVDYVPLERISYYLHGGYLLDLNKNLKFKPAFLVKYTDGAPLSFDVSMLYYLNEKIWLGGSYRLGDSFGALANFKIIDGLFIGYAYDYVTSSLGEYTSGSHELLLSYEFVFPKPKCKCKDLY